jgi:hypothetical protein
MKGKKDFGKKCPRYERPKTTHTYTVPWEIVQFMIYVKWGAHTLGDISPNVSTFRLVDFRFLWFVCVKQDCTVIDRYRNTTKRLTLVRHLAIHFSPRPCHKTELVLNNVVIASTNFDSNCLTVSKERNSVLFPLDG